jgi:hypothetical protein
MSIMTFLNQKYILNAQNVFSPLIHDEIAPILWAEIPVARSRENHKAELCRNGIAAYP